MKVDQEAHSRSTTSLPSSRNSGSRFNTPPDTDEEGPKPLTTQAAELASRVVGLQANSLLPSPSTESSATISTRDNTALGAIRTYNAKGFVQHIRSQRRRRRSAKLYIREGEYQAAVLQIEQDPSLLEFFRDELRQVIYMCLPSAILMAFKNSFDYNRCLHLFSVYMLSTEHEKATEIIVAAITEFFRQSIFFHTTRSAAILCHRHPQ